MAKPTSQYRGVSWHKATQKWYASFSDEGVKKTIGYFDSEIDAAKAYAEVAKRLGKPYTLLPL